MFYYDDNDKRYRIIKEFRMCYLHEYVGKSICFIIRVQVKRKDMKRVWRDIGKIIIILF